MNRYYDPSLQRDVIKLLPGEYAVVRRDAVLATVLGSCVSACIRDDRLGIGGMNHFMLPIDRHVGGEECPGGFGQAARYGVHAMELLVNALIKRGSYRSDLSVKVFGGAALLGRAPTLDVGRQNGTFVRAFLRNEGLRVIAHDLFGTWPRKIMFFPESGDVRVKYLRSLKNDTVANRERRYASTIAAASESGVEMFTWPTKSVS